MSLVALFQGGLLGIIWGLLFFTIFSCSAQAADIISAEQPQSVDLEFGGYRFGQSSAANMVCSTGFCKSQAHGGDGRVTFPFSIYETPGAVSTFSGVLVVNPRYTFWEEHLYRVTFQVDCTPLQAIECLDDIIQSLDREYELIPLTSSDTEYYAKSRRSLSRDFLTESGAYVRVRATRNADGWLMPTVDILDKGIADQVGATLSPTFKPKNVSLPGDFKNK